MKHLVLILVTAVLAAAAVAVTFRKLSPESNPRFFTPKALRSNASNSSSIW